MVCYRIHRQEHAIPLGLHEYAVGNVNPFVGVARLLIFIATGIVASNVSPAADNAKALVKKAKAAEKAGHVTDAYLLYSQAAAASSNSAALWVKATSLKSKAVAEVPAPLVVPEEDPEEDAEEAAPPLFGHISEKDLQDAQQLLPPPTLTPRTERHAIHLNTTARLAFEQVGKLFQYQFVFDSEYPEAGNPIRFDLDNANYLETLRALELATSSFLIPLSNTRLMVAKDSPQKRLDLEPNVVVAISLPTTVGVEDLAELSRSVQQATDLQRMLIDNAQRMIILRGPISKVRPAQQMYTQMLRSKPTVVIDVQLLEFSNSLDASYGMRLPNHTQLVHMGTSMLRLDKLSGATSILTLTLGNLDLFATLSEAASRSILRTSIRAVDGMPAILHVGDRYPIATTIQPASTTTGTGALSYRLPPTFTFEDLGLNLKITPHVHDMDGISLEVESDFKLLSGSSINDIPIISSRKFTSRVRLGEGEWAVLTGLVSTSEANTIAGIPGLMQIPLIGKLFSDNTKNKTRGEALLILRPRLTSLPPSEWVTEIVSTGPEGRPRIPL